jgi:ABC-2 type transport system ATP-binding protein
MDILCGCLGPDHGSARICGYDITEQPIEAKSNLGYLPDVPPLYNDMSVEESLEFAGRIHHLNGTRLRERVEEMLERLSLKDVRYRLVGNLSKGYRQRTAFAQAMVHDPGVLILDEPTEGLDPNQIMHFRELIKDLKENYTIMLSSHILSEVENTCDTIIIINKGRIVKQGSYRELVDSIERSSCLELIVRDHSPRLQQELAGISGVASVEFDEIHAKYQISLLDVGENDPTDSIARLVVDNRYGLRSLTPSQHNLEQVFFQSTRPQ